MSEVYPIVILCALIGLISVAFVIAFICMKDKKEAIGFDRNVKDSVIIVRLLKYAVPYIGSFLLILLIMLVSIAYDIVSPLMVGKIEELVKEDFALSTLFAYVAVYSSILVVSMVCTYLQAIFLQRTGQRIVSAIREDVFNCAEGYSHGQLSHIPVGVLVTRVTTDADRLSVLFTNILVSLVKNVFMIVAVLAAMLFVNYGLTAVAMCFVPFVVLFTVIFRKFSRRAQRMVRDRTTDINIYLSENLSGIKITQIFNREEKKLEEFAEKNNELKKARRGRMLVFGVFRPTVYMLYMSSILVLFYICGRCSIQGGTVLGCAVSSGAVVTFYLYLKKFFNPIQTIAEQFHRLQAAFASAEKIFAVIDTVPEIVDSPDAVDLEKINGEIEFRDVWFEYVPGEPVLRGVSFHIMPGETAAFVGATGAGKTTILSLICRNYEISRGQILIDRTDIKKIKISCLRRNFGQMLQDVFLFSGTIKSNIVLGEESFTDDEIRDVCEYVNADSFINRLENGIEEEVRERGNNFSSGQRQLLSFARTIIHRPSVMILDEATANIDTETELLIQDSLEKIRSIGTMLVVAHRLSTIRSADRIYLLSHGEIIEQGKHEELLKLDGEYKKLYMLQSDINEKRSEFTYSEQRHRKKQTDDKIEIGGQNGDRDY